MKKIKHLLFAIVFTMILSIPLVSVFANQPADPSGYAVIRINQSDKLQNIPSLDNVSEIVATYRQGDEEFGTLTITGTGLYSDNHNNIYAPLNSNVTIDANAVSGDYTATIVKNNVSTGGSTEPLNSITGTTNIDVNFLVNAYLVWSCDNKICYRLVSGLSNNVTFVKDSDLVANNDPTKTFDVHAEAKFFASYTDFNSKKAEIDANSVSINSLIGEDGIDYPPVGEPTSNNAYTSYGNRSFKVTIYGSNYRGITLGSLSDLTYYTSAWTDPLARVESYDISGTTKDNPTDIETILLEPIVNIKALAYNGFTITGIEALDVPDGAVVITKDGDNYKFNFKSHFYDNVVFKVTGSDNKVFYMRINRVVLSTLNKKMVYPPNIGSFDLFTDFYFDRLTSYSNYILKAKIEYKDGTTKIVNMVNAMHIDNGFGDYTDDYEVDEEIAEKHIGPTNGKGLKRSTYKYTFPNGEIKRVDKVYITVEKVGSAEGSYAGTFSGSGKGLVITFEEGRGQ